MSLRIGHLLIYPVDALGQNSKWRGYKKLGLRSDNEPAIKALREAVIRRVGAIKGEGVQVIPEESPVGESQSNGDVEAAVKQVQGQIRTLRLHLQARYQTVLTDDHKIIT